MPFWSRKPLHERLAEEGGLQLPEDPRNAAGESGLRSAGERAAWLMGGLLGTPTPTNRGHPFWDIAGIHGVPRPREWDAVATAEAPGIRGDEVDFVALGNGTLYLDEGVKEESVAPLAAAIDAMLTGPYHAIAVRREGDLWGVAARRIDVVEVPEEVPGDEVHIAVQGEERSVVVDGRPYHGVPSLESFATERFQDYVLEGRRLDATLWEVELLPL